MGNFFDSLQQDLDALDYVSFGADYSTSVATVRAVQSAVNAAGYSPALVVDGLYGPNTTAGIKWLQGQKGIAQSGLVDDATLSALGIAVPAAPVLPPSTSSQKVLPDKSTPLTAAQAAAAFNAAYKKVTGAYPTAAILGLLLAQSALETGGWGRGIHNYNFGNAKASASFPTVQYFTCTEMVGGVLKSFSPPDPTCRFQAFESATDGAVAYIQLLKGRPNWWNGLQTGTVPGFIAGLTSPPAYFTADPNAYAASLTTHLSANAALAAQVAGTASAVGVFAVLGGLAIWLVGGAVTIGGIFAYKALKR